MRIPLSVCFYLSLAPFLAAQRHAPLVAALEKKIPALMEEHCTPGLSISLIRGREIVWERGFGVRVAGQAEKVDIHTIFEAASMSKPLFAYAYLKQVEKGIFDLDRPLDRYLPKPYLPGEPLAGEITARMVLAHTTGFPNWRRRHPLKVKHEPGTRFTYSGEGFVYLQTVFEHVMKERMARYMEKHLFRHLGMRRSSYDWQRRFEANFAGGHDKTGEFKTGRRFYRKGNSAYSLYTTSHDYALFLLEMMNPDRSAAHSLNRTSLKAMLTLQPVRDEKKASARRGLGWVLESPPRGGHVSHSGSNGTGFRCHSRFHPGRGTGVVIMTSAVGGRQVCNAVVKILDGWSRRSL